MGEWIEYVPESWIDVRGARRLSVLVPDSAVVLPVIRNSDDDRIGWALLRDPNDRARGFASLYSTNTIDVSPYTGVRLRFTTGSGTIRYCLDEGETGK